MTTSIENPTLCSLCDEPARYRWPDYCLRHFSEYRHDRRGIRRAGPGRLRPQWEIDAQARYDRIVELVREGLTTTEIANRMKVTRQTVNRAKRDRGLVTRSAPRFTADEIATVEAMLDDGVSYTEIGRTINRPASTICHRWPHRGWSPQQSSELAALVRRAGFGPVLS